MFGNKNLMIIALIVIVNALGYGIIIPILYSYSIKFGLSDWQNGLLFSAFSAAQFLATPVIGRLSDKYGRKPLLVLSLVGTTVSFLLMAVAQNAMWLFVARILDGITAGNIPVAQAVISDSTGPKERAKGFGLIGAAFGFGFVFGPAISAFTTQWGIAIPFWIAAGITAISVILTALMLPETNKHMGEIKQGKLFDWQKLFHMLFHDRVGLTLLVSFVYSLAFGLFIFAYQPVSVKVLDLTPRQIAINFTIFGVIGLISQIGLLPYVSKRLNEKKLLFVSLVLCVGSFVGLANVSSLVMMLILTTLTALGNAFVAPIVNVLLSKEVDMKSQGEILGINASYMSLGMIMGPLLGGAAAEIGLTLPFLVGGILVGVSAWMSTRIRV